MVKLKMHARCAGCDRIEARWRGCCPGCGAWGTMLEEPAFAGAAQPRGAQTMARHARALPIREVALDADARAVTGIAEVDRVLGGGLVPGSVTVVGGEPGAGKSTLLLQVAQALACRGRSVLYLSAEESPAQVRLRAERLEALADGLLLASDCHLPGVVALIEAHLPEVVVLDSIQSLRDPGVAGTAGGVAQVRECADALVRVAKQRRIAIVLVGHVTKDGQLAGPRTLEHVVDVVCELEGERHQALRLLRTAKNRFGPVGEVGCFEMTGTGLRGVEDAGRLFLGEAADGTAGVAVTVALEGRRPLACEVQALVARTRLATPRRVASGLDVQRLHVLLAVLERRARLPLGDHDVYASTVGGVRLGEPGVDLAVCLAVASSRRRRPVPRNLVVLGEVGLAGELRPVPQTQPRLAEAARLGFEGAIMPAAYDGAEFGLRLVRAPDLVRAIGGVLG
jgi:DNA repair protein RadA/Sms